MTPRSLLIECGLFVLALVCAAFFASCETAFFSTSLSAWDRLRQQHKDLDTAYRIWLEKPGLVMTTAVLGNTLASLGASVLISVILRDIGVSVSYSTTVYLALASFLGGALILIFGEVIPKLYARQHHERVVDICASRLTDITQLLTPFLKGLARLADHISETISRRPREPLMTLEELRGAVSGTQSEGLNLAARRILSNIMSFDQVTVRDVMVPRANIIAIRLEQNNERMFESIVRSGFSRIPVYFGNIDNIVGIVYAKDLLVEWRSSGLLVLEDLLRPPYRIAPEAPLSLLLQGFRQGNHMAVVTDKLGRTQGIITIEDVVEAIVGDIADEFDQPQAAYL